MTKYCIYQNRFLLTTNCCQTLIAATCKHYGIKNIATFDSDFDSVDFLDVITP